MKSILFSDVRVRYLQTLSRGAPKLFESTQKCHKVTDGVIVKCNNISSNFTVIVIVIDRKKMKVIVTVIAGQVIYNSLLLLYYCVPFLLLT